MSVSVLSPLEQAHEHANTANEFYSRGLLIPAAEENYKAAEAFMKCVDQATDEHMKNTLRKLYNHHSSVGRDLQRRIAKLKEEGKDPSLPQVPQGPRPQRGQDSPGSANALQRGRPSESLSNTFDESFMILNQRTEIGEESPFDIFWKVTSEIMENLSQPMSFQSAAMAALDAVENRSTSNRSQDEVMDGTDAASSKQHLSKSTSLAKSNGAPRSKMDKDTEIFDIDDEDYDSSDDFCLVPSTSESANTISNLRKENKDLRGKMEAMQNQMLTVRRQMALRNEQDQQLRDHIITARKEAQRVMAASTTLGTAPGSIMNIAGLSMNGPAPGGGRDREVQLLRRIRDLEEECRLVRVENEKQKAMITKFRERWEKLKESAKRKKSAKAAGSDPNSVRERIDEDPEGEEAAAEESNQNAF